MKRKVENNPLESVNLGLIAIFMGLLMLILIASGAEIHSTVENQSSEIVPHVQIEMEHEGFAQQEFSEFYQAEGPILEGTEEVTLEKTSEENLVAGNCYWSRKHKRKFCLAPMSLTWAG